MMNQLRLTQVIALTVARAGLSKQFAEETFLAALYQYYNCKTFALCTTPQGLTILIGMQ